MKAKLITILYFGVLKLCMGYIPMLSDTTVWWHTYKTPKNKGGQCANSVIYAYEDTTIHGLSYKKVFKSDYLYYSFSDFLNRSKSEDSTYITKLGFIREDISQKKVYFRANTLPNSEELLYDFNLQVGDTLTHNLIYRNNHLPTIDLPNTLTISGIETVQWNGNSVHKYYFSQVNTTLGFIMEGVGASAGILNPIEYALKTDTNNPPIFVYQKLQGIWKFPNFKQIQKTTDCPTYSASFSLNWMWENPGSSENECGGNVFNKYCYLNKDTIIENKIYYNIVNYYYQGDTPSGSYECYKRGSGCSQTVNLGVLTRNDTINKRIFIRDISTQKEQVYLDFNALIGNKLRNCYMKKYFNGNVSSVTKDFNTTTGRSINTYTIDKSSLYSFNGEFSINEILLTKSISIDLFEKVDYYYKFTSENNNYLYQKINDRPVCDKYLSIYNNKNIEIKYHYNSIDKTVNLLNNILDFNVYNLQGVDISKTVKISNNILQLQENQLVILAFFNQKTFVKSLKIFPY